MRQEIAQKALEASVEYSNLYVLKTVLRYLYSERKLDVEQLVRMRKDSYDTAVCDSLEKYIAKVTLRQSGLIATLFKSNGVSCCF